MGQTHSVDKSMNDDHDNHIFTENSSGFHMFEFHFKSFSYGLALIVFLAFCIYAYRIYRRERLDDHTQAPPTWMAFSQSRNALLEQATQRANARAEAYEMSLLPVAAAVPPPPTVTHIPRSTSCYSACPSTSTCDQCHSINSVYVP